MESPWGPSDLGVKDRLDGTRISAGISCKKLHLLEKRRTYLTEIRKEEALPALPEGRGLRA